MLPVAAIITLVLSASAPTIEDEWGVVLDRAAIAAEKCEPTSGFNQLFELSVSSKFTGAHHEEQLTQANEDAFLKCPHEFLLSLQSQPTTVQKTVAARKFGLFHTRLELGTVLKEWQDSPDVGSFVRTHFGQYLVAGAR